MPGNLKSSRFASNARLRNAAANTPPLMHGESGPAVAIVQQAFIDLGLAMARSTKKLGRPDGIFGGETESRVWHPGKDRARTRRHRRPQHDGELDELLPTAGPPAKPLPDPGPSHKINVHMRSIDNPVVPEFTQLEVMQVVFSQYLIEVVMMSGESIGSQPGEQLTLNVVEGNCEWDQVSDEQKLLQNQGSKQNVGQNDVTVYFATVLREKRRNVARLRRPSADRPAVMIAADGHRQDHHGARGLPRAVGIELFAGARRRLGQFDVQRRSLCRRHGLPSTVQLKRVFVSKIVQRRQGPTRWVSLFCESATALAIMGRQLPALVRAVRKQRSKWKLRKTD